MPATTTTLQGWTYGYTNADDPLSQADVTPSYTVHGQAYQYDGLHQINAFQPRDCLGQHRPIPCREPDVDVEQSRRLDLVGNHRRHDHDDRHPHA